MISPISQCNFQGKYDYTIHGKNNKNVPLLYNKMADLITGQGIPAQFCMGSKEDKIVLSVESKNKSNFIKENLNKLGIMFSEKEH
jgi:hypothetical protein